jgi:hypothetical protein
VELFDLSSWRDQLEVQFRHVFPLACLNDCSNNNPSSDILHHGSSALSLSHFDSPVARRFTYDVCSGLGRLQARLRFTHHACAMGPLLPLALPEMPPTYSFKNVE